MSKVKYAIGITLFESKKFGGPKICDGMICPTERANKMCCGVIEVMEMAEVKIIGQMDNTIDHTFESANRVYDIGGVAPTMNTCGGSYNYITDEKVCAAMRGRNPTKPSDRTPGIELEQTLELNNNGTSNCLTSVQKDNLVLSKVAIKQNTKQGYIECNIGGVADFSYPNSDTRIGRVQADGEICPTITAENQDVCKIETQYRIRKLTPKECWRLMDFSDEDFEKAEKVNSNTQLYKQAGNSIVVNVLVAILGQLLKGKEDLYKEIS